MLAYIPYMDPMGYDNKWPYKYSQIILIIFLTYDI